MVDRLTYIPGLKPPFGVTLYPGWDNGWRQAKKTISTAPARVIVRGDSASMGQSCSDYNTKPAGIVLRDALRTRLGVTALGADFHSIWRSNASQVASSTTFVGTPPWVVTGSPLWLSQSGFGGQALWIAPTTDVSVATFTTPYACTDIDIVYQNGSASTPAGSYNVDGGAFTSFNATADKAEVRIQLTGLANTTHTIVINGKGAGTFLWFDGITTYKSTRAAANGLYWAQLGINGEQPTDENEDVYQAYAGKVGAAYTNTWFPAQPNLFILNTGINSNASPINSGNQFSADFFMERMYLLLSYVRRGSPNCSIIIVANHLPNNINFDDTVVDPYADSWISFVEAMMTVADLFGCAFVNNHLRWGNTPFANGMVAGATNIHPSDAGHADLAACLAAIL